MRVVVSFKYFTFILIYCFDTLTVAEKLCSQDSNQYIHKYTKYSYLFDYDLIKRTTPNYDNLKVTLKTTPNKGMGVFATQKIEKGDTIAFYCIKVYLKQAYESPFGERYMCKVYDKDEKRIKEYSGDLFEGSRPKPFDNIPFWGYLLNEPDENEDENAYISMNTSDNYSFRDVVKPNDFH